MNILLLSGSSRIESSNVKLLNHIKTLIPSSNFTLADYLGRVPLFTDTKMGSDSYVRRLQYDLSKADAVIISTPEYLHNIPALLKNTFEWFAASGEWHEKKVLAIVYTPTPPRGEKAMQSLKFSLQALNCKVLATLNLYHTDISFDDNSTDPKNNDYELLVEALSLLSNEN